MRSQMMPRMRGPRTIPRTAVLRMLSLKKNLMRIPKLTQMRQKKIQRTQRSRMRAMSKRQSKNPS